MLKPPQNLQAVRRDLFRRPQSENFLKAHEAAAVDFFFLQGKGPFVATAVYPTPDSGLGAVVKVVEQQAQAGRDAQLFHEFPLGGFLIVFTGLNHATRGRIPVAGEYILAA